MSSSSSSPSLCRRVALVLAIAFSASAALAQSNGKGAGEPDVQSALNAHLTVCGACRSYAAGVGMVSTQLREARLEQPQFPVVVPHRSRLRVPTRAEEAMRDLVRVREDVRGDLMRARHRLSGHHRQQSNARNPRHKRTLHCDEPFGHVRGDGGFGSDDPCTGIKRISRDPHR